MKDYERQRTYEYFTDYAIPSRKYAPDNSLSKWYWLGLKVAAWVDSRGYAIRLFLKGIKDYREEYK